MQQGAREVINHAAISMYEKNKKEGFPSHWILLAISKIKQTQRAKAQEISLFIPPGFLNLLDTTGSEDSRNGSGLAELARSDEEGPTKPLEK